jgi:hypothetical protein
MFVRAAVLARTRMSMRQLSREQRTPSAVVLFPDFASRQ